jgi:hypothetical protein
MPWHFPPSNRKSTIFDLQSPNAGSQAHILDLTIRRHPLRIQQKFTLISKGYHSFGMDDRASGHMQALTLPSPSKQGEDEMSTIPERPRYPHIDYVNLTTTLLSTMVMRRA